MQNNTEVAKQKLTWGNKSQIGYSKKLFAKQYLQERQLFSGKVF